MFNDNKLLGSFNLEGIPPAPRGVPQIEVTFDIDANGIVNVKAKDLGTGKETEIKIVASTNLSEAEIKKMQEDAELHAEEDNRRREEIETVNHAEQMVYQTKKTFEENKDKVDQAKVGPIMVKIGELEDLLKAESRNVDKIKALMEEVNKDAQAVFMEMYAKAGAGAEGGAQDANFTESNDDGTFKKKKKKHADKSEDDTVVDTEASEKK